MKRRQFLKTLGFAAVGLVVGVKTEAFAKPVAKTLDSRLADVQALCSYSTQNILSTKHKHTVDNAGASNIKMTRIKL